MFYITILYRIANIVYCKVLFAAKAANVWVGGFCPLHHVSKNFHKYSRIKNIYSLYTVKLDVNKKYL